MKFFANENLLEPIIDYLRSLGSDILSTRDAGLSGISDNEVYQLACNEERVIITVDKDFSRMFRFPPEIRMNASQMWRDHCSQNLQANG